MWLRLMVVLPLALAACSGGGDAAADCPADGCSVSVTANVAYEQDYPPNRRTQPVFDVYAPEEEGSWPVVAIAPSGGQGKEYARDWAMAMVSEGAVVFAVDFEVGPPPIPLGHLNCATRYVRDVADEYGGDPSHVTLLGSSGGAIFGAPVSLGVEGLPPSCLASGDAAIPDAFVGYEAYYGVSDEAKGFRGLEATDWIDPSSLVGQNPDLVVRLLHGDFPDPAGVEMPVSMSEEFADLLADAGYDVEFMVVEGAAHTGIASASSPAFDVIVETTLEVAGG